MKPKGVREAAAAADAMILASQNGETPAPPTTADGEADTQLRVVETPAPEATQDPTTQATSTEALQVQLDQAIREKEQAEDRWRTLDGMLRATNQKLEGLRAIIAASESAAPAAGAAPAASPVELSADKFSDEDADKFGEDLCQYIDARVKALVAGSLATINGRVDQMTQAVETTSQTVALTQQERFDAALDAAVPDWRQIDSDPAFITFLQGSSLYGPAWATAIQSLDSATAIEIFGVYKGAAATAPGAVHDDRMQSQLENQVQPDRSRSDTPAPAADSAEPKLWKLSEIQAFYRDLANPAVRKKYTPAQIDALERDIAQAQTEGRVTYD